jgi:branched-chain amino acid transport system substrate-binding protein
MNKRYLKGLAALLALGLVAAACGDDDDTGGDAAAGDSPDEAAADSGDIMDVVAEDPLSGPEGSGMDRGVSDDSVKIGCIADVRSYAGFEDGVRARFARANDEGGVHGRTIELVGCEDDGGDQQQFQSLTRELVQQDEVFGMITIEGVIPQAAFDFMSQQQVPHTGWGFLPGFCGTRWGFGWNGCLIGNALDDQVPHAVEQANLAEAIIAATGMEGSDVKIALQGEDTESSNVAEEQYVDVWENAGAEVVYAAQNIPVPGPTSDFTPFVRELLDAEPNVVSVSTNFANVGGFTAALTASGYDGTIFNYVAYIPGLLEQSEQLAQALEGSYINSQIVPQEQQTPFVKQMETDLEAADAETGSFITFGGAIGYAQANLWVGLLEAAGEDLDTRTFDENVNGEGTTVTAGADGGPGDLQWPQHHFLPTDCAAVLKVEGGAYTVASEFSCYESIRVR